MVSDPLANPILGLLYGIGREFRIGAQAKVKTDLEGNERIDDLLSHGIHEGATGLRLPLDVISNFRPSGSQGRGLEASVEELVYVEGLTVKFDE